MLVSQQVCAYNQKTRLDYPKSNRVFCSNVFFRICPHFLLRLYAYAFQFKPLIGRKKRYIIICNHILHPVIPPSVSNRNLTERTLFMLFSIFISPLQKYRHLRLTIIVSNKRNYWLTYQGYGSDVRCGRDKTTS